MNDFPRFDMWLPPEIARKAEEPGVSKVSMGWRNMFPLSILAGAFIALGAVFATAVTAGTSENIPFRIVN